MAKELRERHHIYPLLQRAGGKGVAQAVEVGLRDPRLPHAPLEQVLIGSGLIGISADRTSSSIHSPVNKSKMIPKVAGSGARFAASISRLCSLRESTRSSAFLCLSRRTPSMGFSVITLFLTAWPKERCSMFRILVSILGASPPFSFWLPCRLLSRKKSCISSTVRVLIWLVPSRGLTWTRMYIVNWYSRRTGNPSYKKPRLCGGQALCLRN